MLSPTKLRAAAAAAPPAAAGAAPPRPPAARALGLTRCVAPQQRGHSTQREHGAHSQAEAKHHPQHPFAPTALGGRPSAHSASALLAAQHAAAPAAPAAVPAATLAAAAAYHVDADVGGGASSCCRTDSDEPRLVGAHIPLAPRALGGGAAAASSPPPAAVEVARSASPAARAAAPSPGAFAGPPKVPEEEDEPLSLDWVRSLPPARRGPLAGGSAASPSAAAAGDGAGRIHVVMGPMFAGKSTALLEQVSELERRGLRVAVVKSAVDTRYARSWVVTHDGRRARCFAAPTLQAFEEELGPLLDRFHAVAIDEAQFFPDLLGFALDQAETHGRDVLVAGLSCDSARRSFGDLVHLVPHAASVKSLRAVCFYCRSPAPYTVRVVGQGGQQLVGGADKYRPACTRCYHDCTAGRVAA